ncbi:MAG TPA: FAD-binding oxidoreductase [Candidatus Saccharimonadia bacterium]|nr:FAD-binding oxidoreductase [Candidatus Saccharimonadia bacterium]
MKPKPASALLPLWCHTASPLPKHRCIRADELVDPGWRADTIVIGAGVTGLSTALHLAERGARVAVLERNQPGEGTTGSANGQVIAGLQQGPDALVAAYGHERGERLVEFAGNAPALLFDLVARYGIACDVERAGWVQAARSSRGVKSLEKLAESWSRRGAPVRMLDRVSVMRLLGTAAYAGGWLDERNGTIQPLSYARGLAAAAARAGVEIRTGVDVGDVERDRDGQWRIATNLGEVRAPTVVVATNVYTSRLTGLAKTFLGRTYVSAYSVQLASEPLDEALRQCVLPQRHSCGDTGHLRLRYFRLDRDGRFVIGGPGWLTPPRSASATSFRVLEAGARRMFPQLARTRFEYRWAAHDTVTPDLLPHLYEPAPGLFSALGFTGRGLAIGTALGSVLARRVLGESPASLPYPTTPASSLPLNLPAAAKYYLRAGLAKLRREK